MNLRFVIFLAVLLKTSKALVECNGTVKKLQLCFLAEKYDEGTPFPCKGCDPLKVSTSVTVLKIAELDENKNTITLNVLLSVWWNDTRITIETNDPNE
jgi:hypothetical protein